MFGKILYFFLHKYLEIPKKQPKIVCIGGGTGLSILLSGLKAYTRDLKAIVTMCDEGGSTGRLRRILGVPAMGDIRDCLAALSEAEPMMKKLLGYRFNGNDKANGLAGHNLGNLILVALSDITGDFNKGLREASNLLKISGEVLPSTTADAHIWAETVDGKKVFGEDKIDLGHYNGKREIKKLHLTPANARGFKPALKAIEEANLITAGPGDLYTSIMPNLLIKDIREAIKRSKAKKVLIINIANKPFETPNYNIDDYINAIYRHCGHYLFDIVLANNNYTHKIPRNLKYNYVFQNSFLNKDKKHPKIILRDLVNENYPIHHNPEKIARAVIEML